MTIRSSLGFRGFRYLVRNTEDAMDGAMTLRGGLSARLFVLVPTVALSWLLGYENVALVPRLCASLGLGMLLIGLVAFHRSRNG